ncbi:MAG: hypothetical protein ACLP59_13375 [Bryobacteraceae bacterium]
MSLDISPKIEAALAAKAKEQGISIDALLEGLLKDASPLKTGNGDGPPPELPVRHLGVIGSLHRRDIYDDRC